MTAIKLNSSALNYMKYERDMPTNPENVCYSGGAEVVGV
jgi:hypothetical protein